MPFILSIETSTQVCSAAIHHRGKLISSLEVHEENAHASKLAIIIDRILKETKTEKLVAVAVSSGPGSYTGLRIGASTAKGICYAANVPLVSVTTLELLTYQFNQTVSFDGLLCPMVDARRDEVYCMVTDNQLKVIDPLQAKIIDGLSFQNELSNNKIAFFGNGAMKCNRLIKHPNAFFFDGFYPKASALGEMAFQKFTNNEVEDIISFEPHYLKEFIAKTARTIF